MENQAKTLWYLWKCQYSEQFCLKQFQGTRDYCVQYWTIQELILRQKCNTLEQAGWRDSACKDSWELQNSSQTPTIGALSLPSS